MRSFMVFVGLFIACVGVFFYPSASPGAQTVSFEYLVFKVNLTVLGAAIFVGACAWVPDLLSVRIKEALTPEEVQQVSAARKIQDIDNRKAAIYGSIAVAALLGFLVLWHLLAP